MLALVIGTAVCLVLALGVVALVAIPARKEGRDVLTSHGEDVVDLVRERTETTIERTGDLIGSGRPRDHH